MTFLLACVQRDGNERSINNNELLIFLQSCMEMIMKYQITNEYAKGAAHRK